MKYTYCCVCEKPAEIKNNWHRKRKNITCGKRCAKKRKTRQQKIRRWAKRREAERGRLLKLTEEVKKQLTGEALRLKVGTLNDLRDRAARKGATASKKSAPKRKLGAVIVW